MIYKGIHLRKFSWNFPHAIWNVRLQWLEIIISEVISINSQLKTCNNLNFQRDMFLPMFIPQALLVFLYVL